MTEPRWGATPEEWDIWANRLGLKSDLLPVVCNPHAQISPFSRMASIGKTPSVYRDDGTVSGFERWTKHQTTDDDIAAWSAVGDYGICVHTRHVHAFDVDIDDQAKADEIRAILQHAGGFVRWRENSPRFLVMWRIKGRPIDVIRATKFEKGVGMVEYYSLKKQFVAVGTHSSGVRYRWD